MDQVWNSLNARTRETGADVVEGADSEAGMEAAQVILILILIVIALIPAFSFIRQRISQRATEAGNGIGSAS